MIETKHAFLAICLAALAFIGFMVVNQNHASATTLGGTAAQNCGAGGCAVPAAGSSSGSAPAADAQNAAPGSAAGLQVVSVHANAYAYDQPSVTVKSGQPVRFDFSADPASGCGRQIIVDGVGVNLVSRNGETVSATFTPPSPGQYKYHCGMNMFRGVLTAT